MIMRGQEIFPFFSGVPLSIESRVSPFSHHRRLSTHLPHCLCLSIYRRQPFSFLPRRNHRNRRGRQCIHPRLASLGYIRDIRSIDVAPLLLDTRAFTFRSRAGFTNVANLLFPPVYAKVAPINYCSGEQTSERVYYQREREREVIASGIPMIYTRSPEFDKPRFKADMFLRLCFSARVRSCRAGDLRTRLATRRDTRQMMQRFGGCRVNFPQNNTALDRSSRISWWIFLLHPRSRSLLSRITFRAVCVIDLSDDDFFRARSTLSLSVSVCLSVSVPLPGHRETISRQ